MRINRARNKVVILSDRLWRRRFGADPAMVGRSIRINNEPHDVVGIMPADMDQIGDAAEAWVPVAFTPAQLALYDEFYLDAYARQRKDVTQRAGARRVRPRRAGASRGSSRPQSASARPTSSC